MANPNPSPATRFQFGNTANPNGKPIAARHALNAKFVKALSKDFDLHGEAAIQRAREEDPAGYMRVLAGLLPKEVEITRNPLAEMSDEELDAAITAIRSALAKDAGNGEAGARGEGVSEVESPPLH